MNRRDSNKFRSFSGINSTILYTSILISRIKTNTDLRPKKYCYKEVTIHTILAEKYIFALKSTWVFLLWNHFYEYNGRSTLFPKYFHNFLIFYFINTFFSYCPYTKRSRLWCGLLLHFSLASRKRTFRSAH